MTTETWIWVFAVAIPLNLGLIAIFGPDVINSWKEVLKK